MLFRSDIKYKQTKNSNILLGEKITYNEAKKELQNISSSLNLKGEDYDTNLNEDVEQFYYKIDSITLEKLGISESEQQYIINYSTGEVMNYKTKTTNNNEILYIDVE